MEWAVWPDFVAASFSTLNHAAMEDELNDLSLSNPGTGKKDKGGGGGPSFSFKSALGASAFNPGAFEFVPSWEAPQQPQPVHPVQQEKVTSAQSASASAKPATPVVKKSALPKDKSPPKPQQQQQVPAEALITDISQMGKEHLNIIFMGHVDAGKSTMGGHILYRNLTQIPHWNG